MGSLTELAAPAPMVEGRDDAISGAVAGDCGTNLLDDPAVFMAQDEWGRDGDADPWPAALPDVVVAPANPVGLDANQRLVGSTFRIGPILANDERLPDFLDNGCLHSSPLSVHSPRGACYDARDWTG